MKKYNIVAICGEAGSGKDTILKNVMSLKPEWHEIISCTTRPMREGEKNGVNYFFYSSDEFAQKVLDNEMLEATIFNGWCYGTSHDGLNPNTINVGVFNPEGLEILAVDCQVNLMAIFYIAVTPKQRLLRQLNREDNPNINEIIRRFKADQFDFLSIDPRWIIISNENDNNQELAAKEIVNTIIELDNIY